MKLWSRCKSWLVSDSGRKVWEFLMSYLGAVWILRTLGEMGVFGTPAYNNFLFVIILGLIYIAYRKRPEMGRRERVLVGVLTGILATILAVGGRLEARGSIGSILGTLITIITLGAAVYAPMEYFVDFWLKLKLKRDFTLTRKRRLVIFGIIFFSTFLIFLALFPGIFGWDSNLQAWEFIHDQVNQHYSVLLGAVFGLFLKFGEMVLGSYTAGMAMAMFLQMAIMSYVYARIVYFVVEETGSKVVLVGSVAFFTLTLILGIMTIYSTQDVIFGGVFALMFIELYKLAQEPRYWEKWVNILKFVGLGFLLCACRNNGIYVLIVVFFIAMFIKAGRRRNLIIIAVPILLSLLYTKVGFSLLNIPDVDSTREILSVPSQQLARVYVFGKDKMTEEERAKFEEYYELGRFSQYETFTMKADATKAAMNLENVKEDFSGYVGFWAKMGVQHPRAYVEAFLLNSLGTWYPNKKFYDPRADIPYIEFGMSNLRNEGDGRYEDIAIERYSVLPLYRDLLEELFRDNWWQAIPLFSNVISMGSYFLVFVFALSIIIYRKQWRMMIPLGLVIGNYLILMLAPVAVFRYVYPMIIVAPMMIVMVMRNVEKNERMSGARKRVRGLSLKKKGAA